jgi:hypothetical protein
MTQAVISFFFEMGSFTSACSSNDAHNRFIATQGSQRVYIKINQRKNREMKHRTSCILLESRQPPWL